MQTLMQVSDAGIALTKSFEGCILHVYIDIAGYRTIGYGHRLLPDEHIPEPFTEADAEALLRRDMQMAIDAVNRLVSVPLTQGQFDALVDFAFNLGVGTLERSALLHLLNEGHYDSAAEQFLLYVNAAGHKVLGLLRRRTAELRMFERS